MLLREVPSGAEVLVGIAELLPHEGPSGVIVVGDLVGLTVVLADPVAVLLADVYKDSALGEVHEATLRLAVLQATVSNLRSAPSVPLSTISRDKVVTSEAELMAIGVQRVRIR